jgi:hypothetical protein
MDDYTAGSTGMYTTGSSANLMGLEKHNFERRMQESRDRKSVSSDMSGCGSAGPALEMIFGFLFKVACPWIIITSGCFLGYFAFGSGAGAWSGTALGFALVLWRRGFRKAFFQSMWHLFCGWLLITALICIIALITHGPTMITILNQVQSWPRLIFIIIVPCIIELGLFSSRITLSFRTKRVMKSALLAALISGALYSLIFYGRALATMLGSIGPVSTVMVASASILTLSTFSLIPAWISGFVFTRISALRPDWGY